jgi:hypothetical protein
VHVVIDTTAADELHVNAFSVARVTRSRLCQRGHRYSAFGARISELGHILPLAGALRSTQGSRRLQRRRDVRSSAMSVTNYLSSYPSTTSSMKRGTRTLLRFLS